MSSVTACTGGRFFLSVSKEDLDASFERLVDLYYPSQTSVDKGFFRLASGTVGFSPRFKNCGHVVTFFGALRFAKH